VVSQEGDSGGRGKKAEGPIRWTTLGSAPYPKPDEPCSGYLLQGGGANVLVDIGGGVLGPLQRLMKLEDLHAVWVSHLHADHFADMPLLYYAFAYADKPMRKIPVLAPAGWARKVEDFVKSAVDHHMSSFFQVVELKGPRHRRDRRPADPGPRCRAWRACLRADGQAGRSPPGVQRRQRSLRQPGHAGQRARVLVAEVGTDVIEIPSVHLSPKMPAHRQHAGVRG